MSLDGTGLAEGGREAQTPFLFQIMNVLRNHKETGLATTESCEETLRDKSEVKQGGLPCHAVQCELHPEVISRWPRQQWKEPELETPVRKQWH